jgi:hypothetical protein
MIAFTIMPKGSTLLPQQTALVSPLWYLLVMLQSHLLQQERCKAIVQTGHTNRRQQSRQAGTSFLREPHRQDWIERL